MTTESKTSQSQTETTEKRVITIVSTRGDQKVRVNFEGKNWEDLKRILERGGTDADGKKFSGYDLGNMKCVESLKRTTLEHPKAEVPEGNFNLFLMPYKSKSGGRNETYATIKGFIAEDEARAKAHFGNYTQKKTSELEELVESYKPGTKKATSKAKAEAISDVVQSVKTAKAAGAGSDEILENLAGLTDSEKLDLVVQLILDVRNGVAIGGAGEVQAQPKQESQESIDARNKQQEEERIKAEEQRRADEERKKKEQAEREETEKLQREMREMAGGFNDVRL